MKVQNSNNSSLKTRKLIKDTFTQMLSEKREISKITVSDLTKRANISRTTFYSHFDDIYAVAEEFKEELVDAFFSNDQLSSSDDYEKFFASIISFIKENDDTYKMLCRSNEVLFSASKLCVLVCNKFLEIANSDKRIKNKDDLELEIRVFFEGCFVEYIKYCRGKSAFTLDDMYEFSLRWCRRFVEGRGR